MKPRFYTDYRYSDRTDKAKYVWLKYQSIVEKLSHILPLTLD